MNLLIVSDMPHYCTPEGRIVGWGPTVHEIDHLASLFDKIQHIGFLYGGAPANSMLPYTSAKVSFIPLQPSGGPGIINKLGILARAPSYFATILKHLRTADVLHVRCPSSVGLLLMLLLPLLSFPKYRWVKYAGNWRPAGTEDWSYTFQRFWLNLGLHLGVVTVNGTWEDQPKHVYSFLNPSLTTSDLDFGKQVALKKELNPPFQLLYIGRVETPKGCGRLLEISDQLLRQGVSFEVAIIGDGEERPAFEKMATNLGVADRVKFHGWLPHSELSQFYARAHFLVLPTSASEGWPKVLSEGMTYGVVPLAGAVSSIPQILQEYRTGLALDPLDVHAFVDAIRSYLNNPELWAHESQTACHAAKDFTYGAYLKNLRKVFREQWQLEL